MTGATSRDGEGGGHAPDMAVGHVSADSAVGHVSTQHFHTCRRNGESSGDAEHSAGKHMSSGGGRRSAAWSCSRDGAEEDVLNLRTGLDGRMSAEACGFWRRKRGGIVRDVVMDDASRHKIQDKQHLLTSSSTSRQMNIR